MRGTEYILIYEDGSTDKVEALSVKSAIMESAINRQHLKAGWPIRIGDEFGNEYKAELNIERI